MATAFAAESRTNSISASVLVDLGLEAFRHARCLAVIRAITSPAWRTSSATAAGVIAFPWKSGMFFTYPAGVCAAIACHSNPFIGDD